MRDAWDNILRCNRNSLRVRINSDRSNSISSGVCGDNTGHVMFTLDVRSQVRVGASGKPAIVLGPQHTNQSDARHKQAS